MYAYTSFEAPGPVSAVFPGLAELYRCEINANSDATGPPMVRPRLRSLLRSLPPAVVIGRGQGKGCAKGLGAQAVVDQPGKAAVG